MNLPLKGSQNRFLRLTLVISSLGAGGAERVMSILANHWADKGWCVTLLTLDDGSKPPFYQLHPDIRYVPLDLYAPSSNWWQRIHRNLRRMFILRRAIAASQPEAVLCFMDKTNVLVLAATRMLFVPVVVAEHIHTPLAHVGWIWERLRRWLYPRASAIVTLTQRTADIFPDSLQHMITVIPNPVLPPQKIACAGVTPKWKLEGLTIVGMGRLEPQKGFDLLIEAFSQIAEEFREWNLVILGEGTLRKELEALVAQYGLADRIAFPGVVSRPDLYLQQSEIFVLSSRFEGFPMALCEAMVCGLPAIATDCPTGPREIIRSGIDGLLVEPENVVALARAMASLMADETLRRTLGNRAPEILERFGLSHVDALWGNLLHRVISRS